MTGTLKKVGVQGSETYSKLQAQQERLNKSTMNLGGILGRIGLAFSAFAIGKKIVTAGAEIESTRASFEVLLGSVEKGNKMIADIKNYGNLSPYESKDLNENAKMMLAFGIAQQKIMPSMKMLGDVAMGNQEKLNQLTLAYSQVSSAGKMQGQDLLQMINAGFNPLNIISQKTHKSMGELRKEMEKGQISFKMVEDAFKTATSAGGQFYGMAEKQGMTAAGRWSTLMDTINSTFTSLGEKLLPIIKPAIEWMIKGVEMIIPALRWVRNLFMSIYTEINNGNPYWLAFGILIGSISIAILLYKAYTIAAIAVTKVWAFVTGELGMAFQLTGIPLIVAAIVALIAVISYVIYKTDGWGKTWKNTMEYIKTSFQQAGSWLELKWLQVKDVFMSGFELIQKGWYKLEALWDKNAAAQGLATLEDNRNKRAIEILEQQKKVEALSKVRANMKVWEVTWNNKKLSDIVGGMKKALGMNEATSSGTGSDLSTLGATPQVVDNTSKGISSGGSRPTNINITLRNLIENMTIQPASLKEGTSEIDREVRQSLLRVLNSANGVAYGN